MLQGQFGVSYRGFTIAQNHLIHAKLTTQISELCFLSMGTSSGTASKLGATSCPLRLAAGTSSGAATSAGAGPTSPASCSELGGAAAGGAGLVSAAAGLRSGVACGAELE